jgi:hypothetical protein
MNTPPGHPVAHFPARKTAAKHVFSNKPSSSGDHHRKRPANYRPTLMYSTAEMNAASQSISFDQAPPITPENGRPKKLIFPERSQPRHHPTPVTQYSQFTCKLNPEDIDTGLAPGIGFDFRRHP